MKSFLQFFLYSYEHEQIGFPESEDNTHITLLTIITPCCRTKNADCHDAVIIGTFILIITQDINNSSFS